MFVSGHASMDGFSDDVPMYIFFGSLCVCNVYVCAVCIYDYGSGMACYTEVYTVTGIQII